MGKSCKSSCQSACQKPIKICFDLSLYAQSYTIGTLSNGDGTGSPAVLGAIVVNATAGTAGGYGVLTPVITQPYFGTQPVIGQLFPLYLVGGRINNGATQYSLGTAGLGVQIVNGVPRLTIPSYGAAGGAVVNSTLVNFGLSTGATATNVFATGLTVTLYFARR